MIIMTRNNHNFIKPIRRTYDNYDINMPSRRKFTFARNTFSTTRIPDTFPYECPSLPLLHSLASLRLAFATVALLLSLCIINNYSICNFHPISSLNNFHRSFHEHEPLGILFLFFSLPPPAVYYVRFSRVPIFTCSGWQMTIFFFKVTFETTVWRSLDGEGPASVPLLSMSPQRSA